jgi:hypothetical protein
MPPSEWNMFVKKIYNEGKSSNSNYQFKQALKDASKRKSEMGHKSHNKTSRSSIKGKSRSRSASMSGGKRTRRRHRR